MEDWKKTKCGTCVFQRGKPICNSCMNYHYHKPMTNADRIRAMSIQEMSTDLVNIFEELFEDGVPSPQWMKMWLQSEAE